MPLCVRVGQRPPPNSPDPDMGRLCSLRTPAEALYASVRRSKDENGFENAAIHQPSLALLPFSGRYPLRYKDPAASSGRRLHNTEHE